MPSDALTLRAASRGLLLACVAFALFGCPDEKPATAPSRFEGVAAKPAATADTSHFCDKSFPADGPNAKTWAPPALRPLEGAPGVAATKGWRWVNAWATWCTPCVEEMGLLTRWKDGFAQEGLPVTFELMSVDAAEDEAKLKGWLGKNLPGAVTWVKSSDDFPQWLERSLGLDKDSAIPIHMLVDPSGHLRCVRVGAVHAQDYGTVKALLGGR